MPTWIAVKEGSEAAPSVIRTDLSDRYDCTQSTRYGGKLFVVIISASHWWSTLSKAPWTSRKRAQLYSLSFEALCTFSSIRCTASSGE